MADEVVQDMCFDIRNIGTHRSLHFNFYQDTNEVDIAYSTEDGTDEMLVTKMSAKDFHVLALRLCQFARTACDPIWKKNP